VEMRAPNEVPDVVDESDDVDYRIDGDGAKGGRRNRRKLAEAVAKLQVNLITEPRPGKKLLVLDLDYTILGRKAWSDPGIRVRDFMRPHLKFFLDSIYPYYDIVVWSQTSWRWLESKLFEMGMIGTGEMKCHIPFVLDRGPMFSIYSQRKGKSIKHEVKALEIIWNKFPQYNKTNTIHIDDLSRNFAMNPQSGLKIPAFKNASENRGDRELLWATRYLLLIANEPDFSSLDHSLWKLYQGTFPDGTTDPITRR